MIPAEVCLTNRSTQAGLVASNFFGQNTRHRRARRPILRPILGPERDRAHGVRLSGIDGDGCAGRACTVLPDRVQPGRPGRSCGPRRSHARHSKRLADQRENNDRGRGRSVKDAAAAPNSAESMVSQLGGQMGGLFGQVSSSFGQVTQIGQQLPQMLGAGPPNVFGHARARSARCRASTRPRPRRSPRKRRARWAVPVGGLSALAGGGGGGGGLGRSGPSALSSSFVRPASKLQYTELTHAARRLAGRRRTGRLGTSQARDGRGRRNVRRANANSAAKARRMRVRSRHGPCK